MINRKHATRAIILACAALFLFCIGATTVNAQTDMYELINLVENGDFSSDDITRVDNPASGYNVSVIDGRLNYTATSASAASYLFRYKNIFNLAKNDHLFYISFNYESNRNNTIMIPFPNTNELVFNYVGGSGPITFEGIFTYEYTAETNFDIRSNVITWNIGDYRYFDNIVLIDLTNTFGLGYEPSLTDLKLHYLPDRWFDYYSSFDPLEYRDFIMNDYGDLGDNLDTIDFTTSVISMFGENVSVDCYMYLYDNPLGYSGYIDAEHYINQELAPFLFYNKRTFRPLWQYTDDSGRVLKLDMNDEERDVLKRVLFDREVPTSFYLSRGSVMFTFPAGFFDTEPMIFFRLTSKFNLKVSIESLLFAGSYKSSDPMEYTPVSTLILTMRDRHNNIMIPAIRSRIHEDYRTVLINDFGQKYTDVYTFDFGIKLYGGYDDYFNILTITELGLFSKNLVVIPEIVDSDINIEGFVPPAVCEWYQFGCHANNIVNSFASKVYAGLKIDVIVASVVGFWEKITQLASILPDGAGLIIALIVGASGVAIIFIVIDRYGGSS